MINVILTLDIIKEKFGYYKDREYWSIYPKDGEPHHGFLSKVQAEHALGLLNGTIKLREVSFHKSLYNRNRKVYYQ